MAILGEVVIAGSTVDVVVAGAIIGFSVLACLFFYKWHKTKLELRKLKRRKGENEAIYCF